MGPLWKKKKTEEQKARETAALLVGVIAIVGVFFMALQWGDPVDDAYVSFVYAKNLALGNGLVFNPMERVEGYSNFLWVILVGFGGYIFPIPAAAQVFGFLFGIANIVMVYLVARRSGLGSMSHLAAAMYAIDLSASVWNVEGLETPLYTFLILMALFMYLVGATYKSPLQGLWALPALLAAMTRPEGVAVFGALALHRCWRILRSKSGVEARDFIAAAVFVIGYGAYNIWRFVYFGNILPNTFYARGGMGGPVLGALYIAVSLWHGRPVGVLLMVFLAVMGFRVNMSKMAVKDGAILNLGPALTWLGACVAVILATGGDWMPNGRFLVPLLPVFYILCAHGLRYFIHPTLYRGLLSLLIATNIFGQMAYGSGDSFDKRWSREQASFYMPVAGWLSKHQAAGKKVVLSDVGYITYYSNIRAIDTLGLTNKRLARVKGGSAWATDVNYVMNEKPEYIIRMVRDYGNGKEFGHTAFDREVVGDQRFTSGYPEAAAIPGYLATERSLGDLKLRSYKVIFRIYARREP